MAELKSYAVWDQWVAASGVDPATLAPYSPDLYDKTAWDSMRAFRKPFAVVHLYAFYALAVLVVLGCVWPVLRTETDKDLEADYILMLRGRAQ